MGDIMAQNYPIDDDNRASGSRAKCIVHYKFNTDHWEYRDYTGVDVGIDCCLELTENDEWTGNIIECQVKGRTKPKFNVSGDYISLELKRSTLNYALSRANSYVVLLVNLADETIYYLPIQEFFIANPSYFSKLSSTQENITIRIPTDNKVTNDDENLQEIAKSRYVGGPGEGLHKAE